MLSPPDSLPPLHVHEREDEAFHVLEGSLSIRMGEEEEFEAPPGSFVFQPRGIPRAFRTSGEGARCCFDGDAERVRGLLPGVGPPAQAMTLPPPVGPPRARSGWRRWKPPWPSTAAPSRED
jgi:Cupin domain